MNQSSGTIQKGQVDYAKMLDIASYAGKIMLENGGEIYRVEQTINRICKAYGANHVECFATPTTILLSVFGNDDTIKSVVRRIHIRQVNLKRVEAVNTFSRMLTDGNHQGYDTDKHTLQSISTIPTAPLPVMIAASSAGVAGFTILFSGNFAHVPAGIAAGAVMWLILRVLKGFNAGDFLVNTAGGAFSTLIGWLAVHYGIASSWWIITLSSLMLLVPGMMITNALRDIAAGDLIAGGSRGMEAISVATALAFGATVISAILLQVRDIVLWP